VKERRFRADLLARLDGVTLILPPLRERREDVVPLFSMLWTSLGEGTVPSLESDFVEQLSLHDWPLNVRELVLLVRRLRVFHAGENTLRAAHLPPRIGERKDTDGARPMSMPAPPDNPDLAGAPGERVELPELIVALRASQGNVARASALLGITRQRAYRLIEGYAVDLDSIRK
jgi:DNA-binding NtrC family response regulator